MFCQKTGYGGAPKTEKVDYKEKAKPVASRPLTIRFNADVAGAAAAAAYAYAQLKARNVIICECSPTVAISIVAAPAASPIKIVLSSFR